VWHALVGFAAVRKDTVFVTSPSYTYSIDLTTSGWTHLVIGAAFMITGLLVRPRRTLVRVAGIVLTCASLLANFLFIPRHPLWSVTIIAVDLAIMWTLGVYPEKQKR
jgi:hypothetical protein